MEQRTRLWIPETVLTQPEPNLTLEFGLRGFVEVDIVDANTGEIKQQVRSSNIITNSGLDAIGTGIRISDIFSFLEVGTGVTVPVPSDTSLNAPVAPRTNTVLQDDRSEFVSGSSPYWKAIRSRQFTETQANGNLTEMGFWTSQTLGVLANRLLFKDSTGTPTTITKTPNDLMNVRYEWRIYPPTTDATGSMVINGVPYTMYSRPMNIEHPAGWGSYGSANTNLGFQGLLYQLGAWDVASEGVSAYSGSTVDQNRLLSQIGQSPSGHSRAGISSWTVQPYFGGTFYRDIELIWNATSANFGGGIGYFTFRTNGLYGVPHHQLVITPNIPKVVNQFLKMTVRFRWNQYVGTE